MSRNRTSVTLDSNVESLAIDYIRKFASTWQNKGVFFTHRPDAQTRSLKEVFESVGVPVAKDNLGHYTCIDALVRMGQIGLAARAQGAFLYVKSDLPARKNGGTSQPIQSVADLRAQMGL